MPAEADLKIKLQLDAESIKADARKAKDDLSGQLSSVKGSARVEIDKKSLAAATREVERILSKPKNVAIGAGVAGAASDVVAASLAASGHDKLAGALSSAASGATRFATMLAPLGPVALTAGAAFGGMLGALKSVAAASGEAKKAMEAQANAARSIRANAAVNMSHYETLQKVDPQAAANQLAQGVQSARDISILSKINPAAITQEAAANAAIFDPRTVRDSLLRTLKDYKAGSYDEKDWRYVLTDALNIKNLEKARDKDDTVAGFGRAFYQRRIDRAMNQFGYLSEQKIDPERIIANAVKANGGEATSAEIKEALRPGGAVAMHDLLRRKAPERDEAPAVANEDKNTGIARQISALSTPGIDNMQRIGLGVLSGGVDRNEQYFKRMAENLSNIDRNTARRGTAATFAG